jgi:hypothetical protein
MMLNFILFLLKKLSKKQASHLEGAKVSRAACNWQKIELFFQKEV